MSNDIELLRMIKQLQRDVDILKTRDRETGQTGAVLRYYLQNTASDIATYKKMLITVYTPKTTLSTAGLGAGNTVLQNFATDPNIPGLAFIPEGEVQFHIHAAKTAGTKTAVIFAEIWEVSSTGVDIAKIGTTEISPGLVAAETEYTLMFILTAPYVMGSAASRVVARVTATVSGGGSAPTVAIYYGVGADSHVELPSNTVDASNFVPYTGAQLDVDLGLHKLSLGVAKDVFPNGDVAGLIFRDMLGQGFNLKTLASIADNFETVLSGIWTVAAGAPWTAPTTGAFYSCCQFSNLAAQRAFISIGGAMNVYTMVRAALSTVSVGDYVGIRLDDGSDNNYVELDLRYSAANTYDVISRVRAGGGAVTVTSLATLGAFMDFVILAILPVATPTLWTNWTATMNVTSGSPAGLILTSPGGLAFTPTRRGITCSMTATWESAYADWFI